MTTKLRFEALLLLLSACGPLALGHQEPLGEGASALTSAPTGYLDILAANRIAGWAYDPNFAGSIQIEVFVDNVLERTLTANRWRGGLNFWNGGNIAFDNQIVVGCGTHAVAVYAIGANGDGLQTALTAPGATVTNSCSAAGFEGFADVIAYNEVAGWAEGPYGSTVDVEIFVDGVLYTTLAANSYRSDVGAHAFTYWAGLTPSPYYPYDGLALGSGPHRIDVFAVGLDPNGNPNPAYGFYELGESPRTVNGMASELLLTSFDEQVRVVANSQFGGAITKIHDSQQSAPNLIDGDQAGAMFQTAFWLPPPPPGNDSCSALGPEWNLDNPTQGGFYADGAVGNPIGQLGTSGVADPNEFVLSENDGLTWHFKTKLIKYNYCAAGQATLANQSLWDTDFYLEQWLTISPDKQRTLQIESKISYDGQSQYVGSQGNMSSRQLPVIFSHALGTVVWPSSGSQLTGAACPTTASPSAPWAAFVSGNAGIGMVLKPGAYADSGALFECDGAGTASALYSSLPDLASLGQVYGVTPNGGVSDQFSAGGYADFTTYYPIGTIASIQAQAQSLLAAWPGK